MTSETPPKATLKERRDRDDDDHHEHGDDDQLTKARRHDIEVPVSEVDLKLAKKLDTILNISDTRKPRFFTNKPKQASNNCDTESSKTRSNLSDKILLKSKNLTKDKLKQRLHEKYDTLVPELDPKRPTVRVVKVLSATESLELARGEAKKQLEHQLELNSIRANQRVNKNGLSSFRFQESSELPKKCFNPGKGPTSHKFKSVSFAPNDQNERVKESVKYFKPNENEEKSSDSDDNKEEDDDDDDDDDDNDDDDYDDDADDDDDDDDDNDDDGDDDHLMRPDTRPPK